MGTLEELDNVEIAFRQLEFAIKLLTFCEEKKIDPGDFDTAHLIQLKGGNLHFKSGHFPDNDSLIKAAGTSVLLAFSASALVLNKAFEVAGQKLHPEATDNIGQLRLLVYMVRCAHAHDIADPRWEVRGKYARNLAVELDGGQISIDLRPLHGQAIDIDQIGGYVNWYLIREAVVRAIAATL